MYLSQGINDFKGNFFKMAGVFPFETQMKTSKAHLGYREIELEDDCIVGRKGERLRGHEFHYSEIKSSEKLPVKSCESKDKKDSGDLSLVTCYSLLNAHRNEGYRHKKTLASYVHLHFGSNSGIAQDFINFITQEN